MPFSDFGGLKLSIVNLAKPNPRGEQLNPLNYSLDLIEDVEALGEVFEEPKNFELKEWAKDSFGIFHGNQLLGIKLRFTGEAAKRAERVQFHPSQKTSKGRGGSTIIELRCKGHRELIHELCHPD